MKFVDLTARVFGRLTVINREGYSKDGKKITWFCQCSCGNRKIVVGCSLTSGATKSCGCIKLLKLAGMRFGRLRTIELTTEKRSRGRRWLCVCDCGNTLLVEAGSLNNGNSKSCGCLRQENIESRRLLPYEALFNRLVDNAKGRSIACSLTYDDFLEFTKTKSCLYCGGTVEWTEYNPKTGSKASNLDRLNNDIGYIKSNCAVCCYICNKMKLTLGIVEFLNQVKKIAKYQEKNGKY